MSGRDHHQWPPHRGYDPLDPAAAWQGDASTSASAAAAAGVNPYSYVPNPHYVPNPLNLVLNHVLHNPVAVAVAAYHHQQQQQQYHHQRLLHSSAYPQNPTRNLQHRAAVPAPPAPAPARNLQHRPPAAASAASTLAQPQPKKKKQEPPPQAQAQAQAQAQPPRPLPPPQQQPCKQYTALERAQAAARKARDEIIEAGEGVTGWKVAQAVLVALKVDSWGSLGVQLHEVPLLRDLFLIEGKVNAFIHCYVAARKIVSVCDLESEICKNESVGQFEELGLGPFLQHPLVAHYFSVPADSSLVPKLTSEEIIKWLQKLIDSSKKKITVENFLDYLAEQKSVSGKENLGVRIQSLRLHISFLRQARRTEVSAVKIQGNTSGSCDSSHEKDLLKNRKFHFSKQALDERFSAITSRIKKLPGINKHIRFDSTDDETDGNSSSEGDAVDNSESKNGCAAIDNKDADKRVSSCPYPSKTEEMERLGLKSEVSKKPPLDSNKVKESGKKGYTREKRKSEENGSPISMCKWPKKMQKVQMQKHELLPNCSLNIGKLEKFITTWKEACREHPVEQVLDLLANYYAETPKEKKKIIKFFSKYPGIGFLNVAVRAMGCGLLDSLYDAINVFNENKSSSSIADTTTELMEVEPPPSKKKSKCVAKEVNATNDGSKDPGCGVTTDDVIRGITEFFESNHGAAGADALQMGKSTFLRTFINCETCITAKFSASQFSALGHGTFLEFLGKHEQHLPPKLRSFLKGGKFVPSSVEVSVLQQQIEVLLCQAEGNWLEDGGFSEGSLSMLLKRQFPTISFDIVQNKSGEGLRDSIERQRKNIQINNIMFSMSLLEKQWSGIVQGNNDTVDGLMNDVQQSCSITVSSQEAIKCLLKAPMLSDLLTWSHWDLLFAPSLGSFINWSLNTGPVQDLACIVTTDGRFIRVDPSATVDQFLEGIIQCSPFQVAVKLLSLLHIYNGSTNTPTSLLKCYAQRAIGIIMDNSNDLLNTNSEDKSFSARNIRSDMPTDVDSTVHLVAKFVLDCLGHLPSEFRSIAADVLLAGLRTITKNCYSAILHEATETGQLCMLHDIGLSLGVAEWAEDCRRLCLTDEIHAKTETHASSRHPSAASGDATYEISNLLNATDVDITNKRSKSLLGKENQIVPVSKNQNVLNLVTTKLDTAESNANKSPLMGEVNLEEATLVIETIRREEFGLDQSLSYTEDSLLKKQHARLGRALHCLSQELYSQDSHLLLELVQNADDNTYLKNVEPTLAFILQDNGIVVLNNESGFSAENIRALCDIGNSTKKGSNQGYIGNKGIGFKSVFRVTDAPEIHSNGFHVKFDTTEGQIGFVLPTAVAPYNTYSISRMLSVEDDKDSSFWNTCIVLPFRSKFREGTGMHSIASMFSDLHPSLLLFLHRLKCIKFKNMMTDTLLVMRRKALGNGIVRISHGNDIMSWLVVSKKLQGTIVRHDVCSTEIAVAFTLQETQKGEYEPYLKQQPVFAYLPLRNYGLKFILQGDFVLPSSREEVDADNAWNQWLLSEFPSLFVSAQESFCALPCFQSCPGKAVTTFMSFVPLVGEVHGFFCQLPHLILSKLRLTRCMVLEGSSLQWVYPCNTLRGWDEQTRILFSDSLLQEHLGLGYLSKDIIISDTLSRALGIHDYGTKVLIDIMSSICRVVGCIESWGLEWLCAWFIALHLSLMYHSSRNLPLTSPEDLLCALRKIPCIPLSDGSFSSIADGPIWLPYDVFNSKPDTKSSMLNFPILYSNLRIINPHFLSVSCQNKYLIEEMRTNDLMDILLKMGVRKLSGHDIIKNHILVSLSNGTDANMANTMMIEYVSFIALHLQSPCASCNFEKEEIMSELRRRPILLTNHGYKCPSDEPIHFSKEYGNSVDISKLLLNVEVKWIELDSCYLMNRCSDSLPPFELKKWRQFFEEMGVTDFVQVVKVEKNISQAGSFVAGRLSQGHNSGTPCTVYDWESPELVSILSTFSSKKCRENCVYLLEVLDKFWDAHYSAKARIHTDVTHSGETIAVESSFMNSIQSFKWIASAMDEDLHYATDLFYSTEDVCSILGSVAPYAVPQVSSRLLGKDIGFKIKVSHSDALMILRSWIASQAPFSASMDQMCKFYTFVSEGFAAATIDIKQEFLSCSSIFTPLNCARSSEPVPGKFLSPKDLYWHDPTGCSEIITEKVISMKKKKMSMFPRRMLSSAYPSLCEFFTEACGVPKVPKTSDYVDILLGLSNAALPSEVANQVFRVFARWANDFHSSNDNMNDIMFLKESLQKLETTILPTLGDKWVSLHPSFGLVCWVDDNELKQHFEDYNDVDFIQFGELSYEDKQMLYGRIAALMKSLGIPALSKVIYREAIFYGTADNREKVTLISWLLPYMQRYIYKMHRDTYIHFQQNDITKLINFQVIVVEKLFHKYKLRGRESSSKRRFKCNCLLQGNNLYATQEADSHSLFLELSRLFFDGSTDLHFANFLHMVKTMADSGTTAEQIESFIVNNQNVPDLPEQEAVWSFSSLIVADQDVDCQRTELRSICDSQKTEFQSTCELSVSKHQRMSGVASSWPPNDWRTAPDFITSHNSQYAAVQETNLNNVVPSLDLTKTVECENSEDIWGPVELEGDWVIGEDLGSENTVLAERIVATGDEPHMVMSINSANIEPAYLDLETGSSANSAVDSELTEFNDKLVNVSRHRDRLYIKASDGNQSLRTGKNGEAAAHQYFVDRFGSNNVRWVNQESETGLPYDIVITHKEGFTEYVEVKATISSTKNWFHITLREWQFALEKGYSFSIAHVVLTPPKKANVLVLKNPYKLCQQKSLDLALIISENITQKLERKRPYFEGNSDLQTVVNC